MLMWQKQRIRFSFFFTSNFVCVIPTLHDLLWKQFFTATNNLCIQVEETLVHSTSQI